MVDRMYQYGKGVNVASHFEIDDVIDPADTRRWITTIVAAAPEHSGHERKKRPHIDTW
jgi:acetyl-CoA carboxylase carboxyltransferase component